MNIKIKDLKKVIKREKTFSTLAKEEGKGAKKRKIAEKKAGLKESAKDSTREEKIDNTFAKFREGLVEKEKKKLNESKRNRTAKKRD